MRYCSIALIVSITAPAAFADFPYKRPNIDPAGIKGTLIVYGDGEMPDAAFERFVRLASTKDGGRIRIAASPSTPFVRLVEQRSKLAKRIKDSAKPALDFLVAPKSDKTIAVPDNVTGIWFPPGAGPPLAPNSKFEKSFRMYLNRGGVIASSANLISTLCPGAVCVAGSDKSAESRFAEVWKQSPATVGFHFAPKSAMIVSGRRIFFLDDGDVTIHLPNANGRPVIRKTYTGKRRYADLTALRRMAWERTQPPFPPAKRQTPNVVKGTLFIIGGGGTPKGLLKNFVKAAGGNEASIVIFPTASPDPVPTRTGLTRIFKDAGAKKVTVLPQKILADVESPAFLKTLKEATGIWFGGGRQWRFVDAYYGTKAHELMFDVLRRGGAIAGSSAGASIQADYLARGDPVGNLNIIAPGYERGLGFIKGVGIDQHFSQRRRQRDMSLLIKTYPQLLGIGIDEATAIVVKGSVAEVVGRGRVFFYDAQRDRQPGDDDYEAVAAGGRYDLRAREVLTGDNGKK